MLLAELFEDNVKKCCTSSTVEVPGNINIAILNYLYLNKKWEIYLSEKKLSYRTNVYVFADDEAVYDIFKETHKAAAMMSRSSPKNSRSMKITY